MPKALRFIFYPVFFAVCVLVFSVVLFPFDSLKNRVARELEGAMGGGYQITIGKFSPSPLSGAILRNVEVKPRGEPTATSIKLSQAKLKFALIPLLSGTVEIDFDLRLAQGKATGSFSWKRAGMAIDAKLDRFDLGLIDFLSQKVGIPLTGMMSGTVNLEIFPQDPVRNTGNAVLQVQNLEMGELLLAKGFVKIPAIKLAQAGSDSKIDVSVSRGNFEIRSFKFAGGDLNLDTNGKIYGARSTDNYRFNLKGSFQPTAELEPKLDFLSLPDIKKQKAADGSYPFTITGRILKPSIRIGDYKLPI